MWQEVRPNGIDVNPNLVNHHRRPNSRWGRCQRGHDSPSVPSLSVGPQVAVVGALRAGQRGRRARLVITGGGPSGGELRPGRLVLVRPRRFRRPQQVRRASCASGSAVTREFEVDRKAVFPDRVGWCVWWGG